MTPRDRITNLEHEHRPDVIRSRLDKGSRHSYLGDAVLGAMVVVAASSWPVSKSQSLSSQPSRGRVYQREGPFHYYHTAQASD